jgi:hypothetical protein
MKARHIYAFTQFQMAYPEFGGKLALVPLSGKIAKTHHPIDLINTRFIPGAPLICP